MSAANLQYHRDDHETVVSCAVIDLSDPARPKVAAQNKEEVMDKVLKQACIGPLIALGAALGADAAEASKTATRPDTGALVGEPADIAGSAYQYRADRKPDENPPESWLGLMQYAGLPWDKKPDLPSDPKIRQVWCGLLWEEIRPVRTIELVWPAVSPDRWR